MMNQITSILNRLNILESNQQKPKSNLSIDDNVIDVNINPSLPVVNPPPEPDVCPICLDVMGDNGLVTLDCGHKMDLSCFLIFIQTQTGKKCPICRTRINHPPRRRFNPELIDPIFNIPPLPMLIDDGIPLQELILPDLQIFNIRHNRHRRHRPIRPNPPPVVNPQPFRLNQTQSRIINVMGSHHLPTSVIKNRINRTYTRLYSSGCLTTNFGILVTNGYLVRRGNSWRKINRN